MRTARVVNRRGRGGENEKEDVSKSHYRYLCVINNQGWPIFARRWKKRKRATNMCLFLPLRRTFSFSISVTTVRPYTLTLYRFEMVHSLLYFFILVFFCCRCGHADKYFTTFISFWRRRLAHFLASETRRRCYIDRNRQKTNCVAFYALTISPNTCRNIN